MKYFSCFTFMPLLSLDLDFPPTPEGYNTWMDSEAMIQYHLRAMDKQLIQVYRVMAIATMLNRTLVSDDG
jgi:hypothetical protein